MESSNGGKQTGSVGRMVMTSILCFLIASGMAGCDVIKSQETDSQTETTKAGRSDKRKKVDRSRKETSAVRKSGWIDKEDGRHYLGEDGNQITGWILLDDSYFYLDDDGVMLRGWQEIDGNWYFLDEDNGSMHHDVWSGEYYLGSDGKMLTECITPDGFIVDAEGLRISLDELFNRKKAELDAEAEASARETEYYYNDFYTNGYGHYEYSKVDIDRDGFFELVANIAYMQHAQNCRVFSLRNGSLKELEIESSQGSVDGTGYLNSRGYFEIGMGTRSSGYDDYLVIKGDKLVLMHTHDYDNYNGMRYVGDVPEPVCDFDAAIYPDQLIRFNDSAKQYANYTLESLQGMFGSYKIDWETYDDPVWDQLLFGDGDSEYYAFDGTDLIFDIYYGNVCGVCSKNPHHFFDYYGDLTIRHVTAPYESEDLESYAIYAPELASSYARKRVYIPEAPGGFVDVDYSITDGKVTAVYMWLG